MAKKRKKNKHKTNILLYILLGPFALIILAIGVAVNLANGYTEYEKKNQKYTRD